MPLSDDPTLTTIATDLLSNRGCHSVMLYGSRARGTHTANSDYDVLGIRDGGVVERDARYWNGVYLDVFIYPESKILNPDASLLHLRGGVVVTERDTIVTRLLEKLDTLFAAGPAALPQDEKQARRTWAWKMLDRARVGDAEGDLRRHWLLHALLEDYFLLRDQWYLGPKESLRWLNHQHPEIHDAFAEALQPGADLEKIATLVRMVTGKHAPE